MHLLSYSCRVVLTAYGVVDTTIARRIVSSSMSHAHGRSSPAFCAPNRSPKRATSIYALSAHVQSTRRASADQSLLHGLNVGVDGLPRVHYSAWMHGEVRAGPPSLTILPTAMMETTLSVDQVPTYLVLQPNVEPQVRTQFAVASES